jgi:hypothetical protein
METESIQNNQAQEMTTDATNQAATQTGTRPDKVTFTPEQQAKVDEIVKSSMGRAARETRERVAQLEQEVQSLRAKPVLGDDAQQQALEDAHHEAKQLRTVIADMQRDQAIQKAAEGSGFVDHRIVQQLTSKNVRYDDSRGQFIVVDDKGVQRLNSSHEPMTLNEFYAEYADKNPFLVRSEFKGGSGSTPTSQLGSSSIPLAKLFGRGSDAALANKVAKRDPLRYRALRDQARRDGLI